MGKDSYQKRVVRHLGEYKEQRLGVREKGTFTHRGTEREYRHILPRALRWLNIPEPFRMEVRQHIEASDHIKLHKNFDHLNSSQAFALALFVPYLLRAPDVMGKALGVHGFEQWDFEVVPNEDEGTNVDVWWSTRGQETYCEVKLSESEFGGATADKRHLDKLAHIYAPSLRGKVADELLEPKTFFANYQILRNVWLAARPGHEKDRVLFLFPEGNVAVGAQLNAALELVGPSVRPRVSVIHVESLLERLAAVRSVDGLGWYAEMLVEKYVLK